MLQTLNESIRNLGARFDNYQRQVEDRFLKADAEMTLLKNRVDMVEAQQRTKLPIQPPIEVPKPVHWQH